MCNCLRFFLASIMDTIYSFFVNIFKRQTNNTDQASVTANSTKSDRNNNSLNSSTVNKTSPISPSASVNTIALNGNVSSIQPTWSSMRITQNQMLTDNEILAALQVLKNQFEHKTNLKGFFDPQSISNSKIFKRNQDLFYVNFAQDNRFIQILHDGHCHWYF